LSALLWKNAVVRSRTPKTTLCELLSPVLMMSVLVFAFDLSDVIRKSARAYHRLAVDLPGPVEDVLRLFGPDGLSFDDAVLAPDAACANEVEQYCAADAPLPDLGGALPGGARECLTARVPGSSDMPDLSRGCADSLAYWAPPLPESYPAEDDDRWSSEDASDEEKEANRERNTPSTGNSQANAVFELRRSLNRYLRSPLPTPSFDQYVGAGLLLAGSFEDKTYNELLNNNEYGREWGNLFTLGTLHIAPAGELADSLVSYLSSSTLTFSNITHRVHADVPAALAYIDGNLNERAFALVDLRDAVLDPADVDFTIRMNYTTLPNTNRVTDFISLGLNKKYQRYYLSGFLTIQRTLAEFVYATEHCVDPDAEDAELPFSPAADLYAMPMPTPDYEQNVFYTAVGYLLGLAISMGFLYPMSRLVKSVVEEKETRMKETMLILGVDPTVLWFSWVLTAYITFTIIAVMVTYVMSTSFLPASSSVLLFMYIWLFCASVIGFSFFVASFFSKAKLAAIVGPVALFASLMPRWIFYGTNRYEAENSKVWASLLPCTAFAFGADILSDYEYAEIGVQSFNMYEGAYSFNTCLSMMAFDAVFYFFLAWYCNMIIPSEYGVHKSPFFLIYPSFWAGVFQSVTRRAPAYSSLPNDTGSGMPTAPPTPRSDEQNFEPVDSTFTAQVQISHLSKHYAGAPGPAVDDLSLTMYENQIMCLLGHNGAGKTTTISVLTGLYPATGGDCTVFGNTLSEDLAKIRHSTGICPQHNILFPEMTVKEHIVFFNAIKGVTSTNESIEKAAAEVGLGDKLSALSATLSGGMKRKLSVAISLCGNPKFLLLDEPTSGMDPYSRRATWELLRKSKRGRVTLLTTHFMDEADILSDRIAVMKTGRLQCVGSSVFLKKRFGVGYNLTAVVESNTPSTQQGILNFLNHHVHNTEIVSVSGKEISFRLPSGSEDNFPALFSEFEEGGMRKQFAIGGYGISNTTLEEVFISLAKEDGARLSRPNNPLPLRPPSECESVAESEAES
ncbi:hypothetical protein TeGR_g2438, partial [Tetraparma gracilis]